MADRFFGKMKKNDLPRLTEQRECKHCHEVKDIQHFTADKRCTGGYRPVCKPCALSRVSKATRIKQYDSIAKYYG